MSTINSLFCKALVFGCGAITALSAQAAPVYIGFDGLCDVLEINEHPSTPGLFTGRQVNTQGSCASPGLRYLVAGRLQGASQGGGFLVTSESQSAGAVSAARGTQSVLMLEAGNGSGGVTAQTQSGTAAPASDARWQGRTWRVTTAPVYNPGGSTPGSGTVDHGAGTCNANTVSGGYGTTIRDFNTGRNSGSVTLRWDAYGIPDLFEVSYAGNTLFSTGTISGAGSHTVSYSGSSSTVSVKVVGADTGTAWEFTLSCN